MSQVSRLLNLSPGARPHQPTTFTSRTPELTGISGGDGDSVIDNCETGTVSFEVTNSGGAALTNVRVSRVEEVSHPEIEILGTPTVAASKGPIGTVSTRSALTRRGRLVHQRRTIAYPRA